MKTVKALRFAAVIAVVIAAACTTASKRRLEDPSFPLLPGDSRVTHAVESAQLREAMYGLEEITTERIPDELEGKRKRQADLDEIARLADALARAAAEIPDALTTNPLPPDDAKRFRELAEQLVREALALRDRAIRGDVSSARDETETLLATCNACHAFARVTPAAGADSRPEAPIDQPRVLRSPSR